MQTWILTLLPVLSLLAQLGLFFAVALAMLFAVLGVH
jgi:hypothetical protein